MLPSLLHRLISSPDHRQPWRPPVRLIGLLEQVRVWVMPPLRPA